MALESINKENNKNVKAGLIVALFLVTIAYVSADTVFPDYYCFDFDETNSTCWGLSFWNPPQSMITINSSVNVSNDLTVMGNLNLTNNLTVTGNLNVTGISYLGSTILQSENISVDNIKSLSDNIIDIRNSTTIHGDLNVTGTSYLGNVTIKAENVTTDNIESISNDGVTFYDHINTTTYNVTTNAVRDQSSGSYIYFDINGTINYVGETIDST